MGEEVSERERLDLRVTEGDDMDKGGESLFRVFLDLLGVDGGETTGFSSVRS